ncbi:hypothetical protein CR513_14247, partial [Mucuna pruriens]
MNKDRRITRAEVLWGSIDEVDQASTTIEFGKEESGVGLSLRTVDPLKTWPYDTVLTTTFAENATSITTHFHGGSLYCKTMVIIEGWKRTANYLGNIWDLMIALHAESLGMECLGYWSIGI